MTRWLLHSAEDSGSRMSRIVCARVVGWAPKTNGVTHPDNQSLVTMKVEKITDVMMSSAYQV